MCNHNNSELSEVIANKFRFSNGSVLSFGKTYNKANKNSPRVRSASFAVRLLCTFVQTSWCRSAVEVATAAWAVTLMCLHFSSVSSALFCRVLPEGPEKRVRLNGTGRAKINQFWKYCNCCTHFEMQLGEYGQQVLGHGMLGRPTVMAHLDQRLLGAVGHRQTRFALFQTVLHLYDKTSDDINIPHGSSTIGNLFSNSFYFPTFRFNHT